MKITVSGSRVVFRLPCERVGETTVVDIFDGLGKRVGSVAGESEAVWETKKLGAGVYFCRSMVTGNARSGCYMVSGK